MLISAAGRKQGTSFYFLNIHELMGYGIIAAFVKGKGTYFLERGVSASGMESPILSNLHG
jgi:hypothetical protein